MQGAGHARRADRRRNAAALKHEALEQGGLTHQGLSRQS